MFILFLPRPKVSESQHLNSELVFRCERDATHHLLKVDEFTVKRFAALVKKRQVWQEKTRRQAARSRGHKHTEHVTSHRTIKQTAGSETCFYSNISTKQRKTKQIT